MISLFLFIAADAVGGKKKNLLLKDGCLSIKGKNKGEKMKMKKTSCVIAAIPKEGVAPSI